MMMRARLGEQRRPVFPVAEESAGRMPAELPARAQPQPEFPVLIPPTHGFVVTAGSFPRLSANYRGVRNDVDVEQTVQVVRREPVDIVFCPEHGTIGIREGGFRMPLERTQADRDEFRAQ